VLGFICGLGARGDRSRCGKIDRLVYKAAKAKVQPLTQWIGCEVIRSADVFLDHQERI